MSLAFILIVYSISSKGSTTTDKDSFDWVSATALSMSSVLFWEVGSGSNRTRVWPWLMRILQNVFKQFSSTRWVRFETMVFDLKHDIDVLIYSWIILTKDGEPSTTVFFPENGFVFWAQITWFKTIVSKKRVCQTQWMCSFSFAGAYSIRLVRDGSFDLNFAASSSSHLSTAKFILHIKCVFVFWSG